MCASVHMCMLVCMYSRIIRINILVFVASACASAHARKSVFPTCSVHLRDENRVNVFIYRKYLCENITSVCLCARLC